MDEPIASLIDGAWRCPKSPEARTGNLQFPKTVFRRSKQHRPVGYAFDSAKNGHFSAKVQYKLCKTDPGRLRSESARAPVVPIPTRLEARDAEGNFAIDNLFQTG
jgi:hypothetical protein